MFQVASWGIIGCLRISGDFSSLVFSFAASNHPYEDARDGGATAGGGGGG